MKLRLFVVEDTDHTYVFDEATLNLAGLGSVEKQQEAFGDRGAWRSVTFRKPLGRHAREIASLCQVADPVTGFRMDATREAAARFAVLVEAWEGFAEPPSFDAFENLPLPLAEAIDGALQAHMYPNILANPDFTNAWKGNSQASAPTPAAD